MTNWIKVAIGVALAGAAVAGGGSVLTAITKAKGETTEAKTENNEDIIDIPKDTEEDAEVIDVTETSDETEE